MERGEAVHADVVVAAPWRELKANAAADLGAILGDHLAPHPGVPTPAYGSSPVQQHQQPQPGVAIPPYGSAPIQHQQQQQQQRKQQQQQCQQPQQPPPPPQQQLGVAPITPPPPPSRAPGFTTFSPVAAGEREAADFR